MLWDTLEVYLRKLKCCTLAHCHRYQEQGGVVYNLLASTYIHLLLKKVETLCLNSYIRCVNYLSKNAKSKNLYYIDVELGLIPTPTPTFFNLTR